MLVGAVPEKKVKPPEFMTGPVPSWTGLPEFTVVVNRTRIYCPVTTYLLTVVLMAGR